MQVGLSELQRKAQGAGRKAQDANFVGAQVLAEQGSESAKNRHDLNAAPKTFRQN